MKALLAFWKKDIINKLIVLITAGLVIGLMVIAALLLNMKSDSIFYSVFASNSGSGDGIPTLAGGNTIRITETPLVFPTNTPTQEAPAPEQPAPTETAVATSTIQAPIPASETPPPSPTATSPQALPTKTSQEAAACIPAGLGQTGKVLDVIDGNTVKVLIDGIAYTVRYIGIDVPAYRPVPEYFGQEADFKNAELVFAKQVTLFADGDDKDENGRLLRYLKVGDLFVNYELVRQGFARVNQDTSACSQVFKTIEQTASQAAIGIWKPTPTPPKP